MKKLIVFAIAILGFTAVSFGQTNSATNTATANVLSALTIVKGNDLAFGTIGALTSQSLAVMSTGGDRSASTSNLIALAPGNPGSFTVTGDEGSSFVVTTPSGDTPLTGGLGTTPMNIAAGTWTVKIDAAADGKTGVILAGGTTVLKVGATLTVGASQKKGPYTGTFSVSVNYN